MNKGELDLYNDVYTVLIPEGLDNDDAHEITRAIVDKIKTGNYFVHIGEILSVSWDNVADWLDDGVVYSIKTEVPED